MLSRFEDVKSYSMELESVLTALLQIREVIYVTCFVKELLRIMYMSCAIPSYHDTTIGIVNIDCIMQSVI